MIKNQDFIQKYFQEMEEIISTISREDIDNIVEEIRGFLKLRL